MIYGLHRGQSMFHDNDNFFNNCYNYFIEEPIFKKSHKFKLYKANSTYCAISMWKSLIPLSSSYRLFLRSWRIFKAICKIARFSFKFSTRCSTFEQKTDPVRLSYYSIVSLFQANYPFSHCKLHLCCVGHGFCRPCDF